MKKKSKNKKVLVGGCFDILHFGHISFLRSAKKLGDRLIVALESDANVKRLKGINRPIHSQKQRKAMLLALRFVDQVIMLPEMKSDEEYEKMIERLSPQIIAVTARDPILKKKRKHAKKVGARLVIIPKINASSTTQIAKIIKLE